MVSQTLSFPHPIRPGVLQSALVNCMHAVRTFMDQLSTITGSATGMATSSDISGTGRPGVHRVILMSPPPVLPSAKCVSKLVSYTCKQEFTRVVAPAISAHQLD